MVSRYICIYLFVDLACAILAGSLLLQVGEDFGTKDEVDSFRRLSIVFLIYLVTDVAWMVSGYDIVSLPRACDYVLCGLSLFALSPVYYCWAAYVELRLDSRISHSRAARVLSRVPMAVMLVIVVSSLFTNAAFFIDDQGLYQHGPLYWVTLVCSVGYVAFATAHTLRNALVARSRTKRDRYLDLAVCGIGPVIASALLLVVGSSVITSLGMTSAIFLVFCACQKDSIYSDALTGLNNRRRADEFFESRLSLVSNERPLSVMMCDVDKFKSINDIYGHDVGDKALMLVGASLKDMGDDIDGLIARWGGDEFLVISQGEGLSAEGVESRLNASIERACERDGLPFSFRVSVGGTVCREPSMSLDDATLAADRVLYQHKHARTRGGATA
ncbi:MAG: GGDEF domain-containing protein [Olsenella sp.]|nr:GGDEF domain-containing protein [Olsenella sp.]